MGVVEATQIWHLDMDDARRCVRHVCRDVLKRVAPLVHHQFDIDAVLVQYPTQTRHMQYLTLTTSRIEEVFDPQGEGRSDPAKVPQVCSDLLNIAGEGLTKGAVATKMESRLEGIDRARFRTRSRTHFT